MSGMRARYPGFEYENYEDFCRRTPDVIPEQVWIPQPPYLEYWEGAEIKAVETNKNVSRDEKKLKTTVSEGKLSKPAVQVGKDNKAAKIQQKKEKPVKKPVKKEKINVEEKKNSKKELKPAKKVSVKNKLIPGKIIVDALVKKVPCVTKVIRKKQSTSLSL